jgi:hypothetical protein
MASNRPTKETIYVRRNFTQEERLEMGTDLAQAHNRLEAIDAEEAVMKTQIKSSKATVSQRITDLSRKINDGFDMANVACELKWDTPNVGEVSYIGPDGKVEKTRAMTPAERQEELNFDETTSVPAEVPDGQAQASVLESAKNAAEFFDTADKALPSAADLDAVAEEEQAAEATGDSSESASEENF